ncbi:efflux RND transporter periplasmic adaptor subunit [Halioxenophilus aromaticivorans]|uniref:Efflux RND transporter periplasmic adaptor subunit n=1 Tax=Halioxenophilus aromaticivorans TaxID=1306992 RepID=A0AAV3U8P2_9ALTE
MDNPLRLRVAHAALLACLLSPCLSYAQNTAPVSVAEPQSQAASQSIQLSGTVRAVQVSNLSARVDGAVDKLLIDDGSRVQAGDVLIELDDSLEKIELSRLRAELERAQAEAGEAQRLVSEAQRLSQQKHIALTELALRQANQATTQAALKGAQAAVAAQQQRLQYHKITAPFTGVVSQRLTEQGEWITRGTAVLELVATEATYLDVEIPQSLFYSLSSNTQVEIKPDTNPNTILPARIHTSIPVANAVSRTFRLRLVADNPGNALPPGSSATATFSTAQADDSVLTVPRDAILRNPDNSFAVFIVDEQSDPAIAKRQPVKVGQILGDQIEVISGLDANSQVVVRGNEILRNNQPIKIVR